MLRLGKVKESVYNRSIKKQIHNVNQAAPFLARTVHVEGWTLAGERVVYNLINAFAACRGQLAQITVSVMMPEGTEESDLKSFSKDLGRLCRERGIWLSVAEAKVNPKVSAVEIQAVGMGSGETNPFPKLEADLDLILAGSVACEGAAVIACEAEDKLLGRFAGFYVDRAKQLFDDAAMEAVGNLLLKEDAWGAAVGEGGIFAGLWDMAAAGKVGLDIDLGAIPIRQHTIEVCEFFNLNPYMLLSGGCLLIAARHGESMVSALRNLGINSSVIGRTTSGNDRIIRYDTEIRYLEPPKTDEIYRSRED